MEKELSLLLKKDLCGRATCGLRGKFIDERHKHTPFDPLVDNLLFNIMRPALWFDGSIKPYLFPLSSMTEEQKIECFRGTDIEINNHNEIWSKFPISIDDIILTSIEEWLKVIDYLNANHFDYRGLIPLGLAIDATDLGIY